VLYCLAGPSKPGCSLCVGVSEWGECLMRHPVVRSLVVCFIVIVLISGLQPAVPVQAQPLFEVIKQSTESNFRESFIFRVNVRSNTANIVKARLLWNSGTKDSTEILTGFIPAPEVNLEYIWHTSESTTPPWQIIAYQWELTDTAGNTFTTPTTQSEIIDSTRDWQTLADGKVAVYWYGRDQAFGEELLDVTRSGYNRVVEVTGYTPQTQLRVIMYNDSESFCSIFAPNQCRDWIAGITLGTLTVQWMDESQPDSKTNRQFVMRQVVPHELAHAFMQDWLGPHLNELPRWFNEGYATNNELEGLSTELRRARDLAQMNMLDRVDNLDNFGAIARGTSETVANWYSEATSLVTFLYDRYGVGSVGSIVEKLKAGQDFEQALQETTGVTLREFEQAWREWLGLYEPLPNP
jgi:hypothetical protein